MRQGFLGLSWSALPGAEAAARAIAQIASDRLGLSAVLDSGSIIVLADPELRTVRSSDGRSVILGTIFRRHGDFAPISEGCQEVGPQVTKTAAASLLAECWGSYVAVVAASSDGSDTAYVLRDPTGSIPCYIARTEGVRVFFSSIDFPIELGILEAKVDWDYVAHHLAFYGARSAITGIAGVEDILPGHRVAFQPDSTSITTCWTPWAFASRALEILSTADAIALVAETTRHCVRSWAGQQRSILLELSGGLDSSIIAECLREDADKTTCVTLVTSDPGVDERHYARLVADCIGAQMVEATIDIAGSDLALAPSMREPRPGIGPLQQAADRTFLAQAIAIGAESFMSGGGGDNVFCSLSTAAPAADMLRARGFGLPFLRSVAELAAVHGSTSWRAGQLAVRKAYRRRPRARPRNVSFLMPHAVPALPHNHPWLEPTGTALPGKQEHIASIVATQSATGGLDRVRIGPICYPLLSQPVVEACLRIPTWMWIAGGKNRSIARDAFAASLPTEIIARRTKGNFSHYCGKIYENSREILKPLLLEGVIAKSGILDRPAIERYLASPLSARDYSFERLLDIAGVEAWARSWAPGAPSAWRSAA